MFSGPGHSFTFAHRNLPTENQVKVVFDYGKKQDEFKLHQEFRLVPGGACLFSQLVRKTEMTTVEGDRDVVTLYLKRYMVAAARSGWSLTVKPIVRP